MGARVHLCGRLQVEWDGERLEDALPGRQGRLLFAFLTLHRDRVVRRDELVEALWPDDGPSPGADALLRPPLSRLRSALGQGRLEGRGELVVRFPADTWIDREVVRDAARLSRSSYAAGDALASWETATEALAIAEHELLPGIQTGWLMPFRTELDEQRVELLETIARAGCRLGDGELPAAEHAARRAIEAAPFRESARVALLEILRRRGNVAEALVVYDEFRTFLREELGTSPGRELLALHEDLLHVEPPAPRPAAPASPQRLPDRLAQALMTPWVGREAALVRLREEAAAVAGGRTALVLVAGEGGIGKTRLVAELAAGLAGFDVLYGRCDEEEIFPYGPWADLLRRRLDRMGEAELVAVLGRDAADLARLVPELHGRLPAVGRPASTGDPETERRVLFAAVTRVVGRLARRRPLLLVVDDLHWADRSSLLLGRHLAREPQLGPVLLLGTFRDTELDPGHPLPEILADVERDLLVPRVRLAGMDEREVAAMIGSWRGAELEERAVRAIWEETDGNPFFVGQLVRHLEEAGDDDPLEGGTGLGVPDGVRDVIARRVARLPDRAGHVLRVAALAGREVDYELLERITDVPSGELLDVLDAAVRGGLLTEVPSTPGRYSFAHALLRSTMEAELSATRKALMHRRIGEAIEAHHGDRLDELARHFAAAGPQEADRAVAYAVRAAEAATARLAHDEAVRLLERAVAPLRSGGATGLAEMAHLEIALATAQGGAGRWAAARASFVRAAEAARGAGAGEAFARAALGHAGEAWEQHGQADPIGLALLEEALERLPGEDSRLRSQVLARLAALMYEFGESSEAVLRRAADAADMARRMGDTEALIAALGAAQYARWRPGRAEDRLAIADEAIGLTESGGALRDEAEAHMWRAAALLELCRLGDADVSIARFGAIAGQARNERLLVLGDGMRSMRAQLEGDWETAAAAAEQVLDRGRRAEARGGTPLALQVHGVAMLTLLGERGELGLLTPSFEQLAREIRALPGWRAVLAWAQVQGGRPEQGRAGLEELSADAFVAVPRDANLLPTLAIAAHAIGELGDVGLADATEPVLARFDAVWVVFGAASGTLGPVAYSLGLLRLLQDRYEEAILSFEAALGLSELMRARPYVARSRAGLADALRRRAQPGDVARADELSALAAAAARELGMTRLERELG